MLSLRRPTRARIEQYLEAQRTEPFSYSEVGATRTEPPAGYIVDHNRTRLGDADCFDRAKQAVREWQMQGMPWVTLFWHDAPIQPEACVAVLVRVLGMWSLNPCRIVYVIDEPDRFGFGYGTLGDHAERGEERFLVERDGDGVWYDILAFSRPRHPLARLCYPITRALQRRFARDSLAAMRAATAR